MGCLSSVLRASVGTKRYEKINIDSERNQLISFKSRSLHVTHPDVVDALLLFLSAFMLLETQLEFLEAFLLLLTLFTSLEGLNVALVIRTDTVPDGREGTVLKQSGISGVLGMFQQAGGQAVVVVPLFNRIVFGGVRKIFFPVLNQKLFEFRIGLPGKLLASVFLSLWFLDNRLLFGTRAMSRLALIGGRLAGQSSRFSCQGSNALRWL